MAFCQFLSAQFSRLKSAAVCGSSSFALPEPSAVVASFVVVAVELGLAEGDGEVLADGDGEVLDLAPSARAPTAWPVPPVVALLLGPEDVVGVGLAEPDGLTDGLGLPEAFAVGVVLGVAAAVVTVFGAD